MASEEYHFTRHYYFSLLQQRLAQTDKAAENFNQLIASLEQKLKAAKEANEKENLKPELMMTYFSRSRVFA